MGRDLGEEGQQLAPFRISVWFLKLHFKFNLIQAADCTGGMSQQVPALCLCTCSCMCAFAQQECLQKYQGLLQADV